MANDRFSVNCDNFKFGVDCSRRFLVLFCEDLFNYKTLINGCMTNARYQIPWLFPAFFSCFSWLSANIFFPESILLKSEIFEIYLNFDTFSSIFCSPTVSQTYILWIFIWIPWLFSNFSRKNEFPEFSLTFLDLAGTLLYSNMLVKTAHKLYSTLMPWERKFEQGIWTSAEAQIDGLKIMTTCLARKNVHFFLLYWPCWTSKENEISWAGSLSTKYIWKFLWYC